MLVASLATSAWTSCVGGPDMTAKAQMACCKSGQHNCPMHGSAEGCCKVEGQRQQQVSVATHDLARFPLNPPFLAARIIATSFVPQFVPFARFASPRDTLKGPSPPPYLLGSAFLI